MRQAFDRGNDPFVSGDGLVDRRIIQVAGGMDLDVAQAAVRENLNHVVIGAVSPGNRQ